MLCVIILGLRRIFVFTSSDSHQVELEQWTGLLYQCRDFVLYDA